MEVKSAGSGSTGEASGNPITPSEAAAYIGKTVTVHYTDDDDNKIEVEGEVTAVKTGKNGQTLLVIDGNEYPISAVTAVS